MPTSTTRHDSLEYLKKLFQHRIDSFAGDGYLTITDSKPLPDYRWIKLRHQHKNVTIILTASYADNVMIQRTNGLLRYIGPITG